MGPVVETKEKMIGHACRIIVRMHVRGFYQVFNLIKSILLKINYRSQKKVIPNLLILELNLAKIFDEVVLWDNDSKAKILYLWYSIQ